MINNKINKNHVYRSCLLCSPSLRPPDTMFGYHVYKFSPSIGLHRSLKVYLYFIYPCFCPSHYASTIKRYYALDFRYSLNTNDHTLNNFAHNNFEASYYLDPTGDRNLFKSCMTKLDTVTDYPKLQ